MHRQLNIPLKVYQLFSCFPFYPLRSIHQAKNARGLLAIKIRLRDLRTLTVWESIEDMQSFRNSQVHLKAMKDSPKLGLNQSHTWCTEHLPDWSEIIARFNSSHDKRS